MSGQCEICYEHALDCECEQPHLGHIPKKEAVHHPYGILDKSVSGEWCGSLSLREAMFRVKPKYLICGHIHECGGKQVDLCTTYVSNCSYVNECYEPIHKPIHLLHH